MTALPRKLARWKTELSLFPADVGVQLGDLVARLAPAFDAATHQHAADQGEVDGFDGLSLRGSYERLLASEWALLKSAPLEFLRRAANAEHLFLQWARREPASPKGTLAILETGPDQLGHCRLAQLALLILLSERATRTRSRFDWQLLHHQGEGFLSGLDEHTVKAFLAGRTGLRLGPSALADWLRVGADRERWWIGSGRLVRALPPGERSVTICERVEPGRPLLDVRVQSGGRPCGSVTVELPEPADATRLLRDPFESRRTAATRSQLPELGTSMLLSATGSRLFVRTTSGDLLAMSVPNSPRNPPTTRTYSAPAGVAVLGAAKQARRTTWLRFRPGTAILESSKPLRRGLPPVLECPVPILEAPSNLSPLMGGGGPRVVFVAGEDLFRVDFDEQSSDPIAQGVAATASLPDGGGLVAVRRYAKADFKPAVVRIFHSGQDVPTPLPYQGSATVFLRVCSVKPERFVVAEELSPGSFQITRHLQEHPDAAQPAPVVLHAPAGTTVIGVDAVGRELAELGLYLMEADQQQISLIGRSHHRELVRTSSPIESVTLATHRGLLAYYTESGELGFVERSGKMLWRGERHP